MSGTVAIVTDSTAYLPSTQAAAAGITVVPVSVVISGTQYDEGVDVTPEQVAQALREWEIVTTSRPAPERFLAAFRAAADAGATEIVSIHVSADMSGTYDSAVLAAKESPIPVEVVDSRVIAMSMGYAVLSAATVANAGGDRFDVARAARDRAARSATYFCVDSLEHLRRSGRITGAAKIVGVALAVKPILQLSDGRVTPMERVRTSGRALARLSELAVSAAGAGAVDVTVHHLAALDRANVLADIIHGSLPRADVVVGEVGAAVGAHVGPGMVAVAVSPR